MRYDALILLAVVGVIVLWRRWPDVCTAIVNAGLKPPRGPDPTPVERLHPIIQPPTNAAQATAAAAPGVSDVRDVVTQTLGRASPRGT
ncbi:MAG: hypothetical protein ACJ8C4_05825 [Gemmataceae bacterium]